MAIRISHGPIIKSPISFHLLLLLLLLLLLHFHDTNTTSRVMAQLKGEDSHRLNVNGDSPVGRLAGIGGGGRGIGGHGGSGRVRRGDD